MKKSSMFNTFVDIIQKKYDVDFFFSKWKLSSKCLCVANVTIGDVL